MSNEALAVLRAAEQWSRDEVVTLGGTIKSLSEFCWMRPAQCHQLREKIEAWIKAGRPGLDPPPEDET